MHYLRSTLILALALTPMFVASEALADKCKSPKIVVKNDRSSTIKVKKIQYYDGCNNKWRTEDVPNKEIKSGHSHTFTNNLEYVENCPVSKFKLFRAVRKDSGSKYGDFKWGAVLKPDGGTKVCRTGTTYTIHAFE